MSNREPSPPRADPDPDLFKSPPVEVEGLESFEEEPASSQPPPPRQAAPRGPGDPHAPPARPASGSGTRSQGGGRRSVSVFWPLLLIMAGALLLLQNLGYLSGLSWSALWRLWPLFLIALGIDTLLSRRSALGSLVSILLILALLGGAVYLLFNASSLPWLPRVFQETGWQSEQISHPLAGVERARVRIDWSSLPLRLEPLGDSPNLIEGTVVYRGRLNLSTVQGSRTTVRLSTDSGPGWGPGLSWAPPEGVERRWALGLSTRVPIDLELDGGSGSAEVDLRGLDLEALRLDVGSGSVDLHLPRGEYEARVEGSSGSLDLWLPKEAGVRVEVDGGSGSVRLGERFRLVDGERDGDGVWESDNWAQAGAQLRLRLDVASGSVRVRDWE